KALDVKAQKPKNPPLEMKIEQAGLSWTKQRFMIISAALGLFLFALVFILGGGLPMALALGFAGGFGMPRWFLSYLKKRREKRFLETFPDAVDVIVRGIKAGLPLLDSMKIISHEAPATSKTEFR